MKYIKGLSADMDDLLTENGRKTAIEFFKYVCWCMEHDIYEAIQRVPGLRRIFLSVLQNRLRKRRMEMWS